MILPAGYPLYLRLGYHPTVKFMGCMLAALRSGGNPRSGRHRSSRTGELFRWVDDRGNSDAIPMVR
jgi:hypothetical protein